jgi:hypothetical protein
MMIKLFRIRQLILQEEALPCRRGVARSERQLGPRCHPSGEWGRVCRSASRHTTRDLPSSPIVVPSTQNSSTPHAGCTACSNTCGRPTSAQATNTAPVQPPESSEDEYKFLDDELCTLATAVCPRVETVPKCSELTIHAYASHFGRLEDLTDSGGRRSASWPHTSVALCVPTARGTLAPERTLRGGTPPHSASAGAHAAFDTDNNLSEYLMSLLQPDVTKAIGDTFTKDAWSADTSSPSTDELSAPGHRTSRSSLHSMTTLQSPRAPT